MDRNNLRKIRAHQITREEAEQALLNGPIPVYEQAVERERRFVYYGETDASLFLALVVTERGDRIRVVTVRKESDLMNKKSLQLPQKFLKFRNESEEADWWASPAGRTFVKQKSTGAKLKGTKIG